MYNGNQCHTEFSKIQPLFRLYRAPSFAFCVMQHGVRIDSPKSEKLLSPKAVDNFVGKSPNSDQKAQK